MTWDGEKPKRVRIYEDASATKRLGVFLDPRRVRFEDGCVLVEWESPEGDKRMDIISLDGGIRVDVEFDYKEWNLENIEEGFIAISCPNCGKFHRPRTTPDQRGLSLECEFCKKTMKIP
jgi:hypothetical protein